MYVFCRRDFLAGVYNHPRPTSSKTVKGLSKIQLFFDKSFSIVLMSTFDKYSLPMYTAKRTFYLDNCPSQRKS